VATGGVNHFEGFLTRDLLSADQPPDAAGRRSSVALPGRAGFRRRQRHGRFPPAQPVTEDRHPPSGRPDRPGALRLGVGRPAL